MRRRANVSEAERLRLVLRLGRRVTSILDLEVLLPEACRLIAEGYDLTMFKEDEINLETAFMHLTKGITS